MLALYTAASGMAAMEKNVEVISNNIANTKTTAYKRQSAQFQDLLYQINTRAGSSTSSSGTLLPAGIEIGTGVRLVSTVRTMSQGTITASDRNLDVAISGKGYFRIQRPDGTVGYTRDGAFTTDAQGRYFLRTVCPSGYPVPTDGPCGELLDAQLRHPNRPAHLHFMISSPGHKVLITQVFADDDVNLSSDPVFGVTAPLVGHFEKHTANGQTVAQLTQDFHLVPGEMVFPHPPIP